LEDVGTMKMYVGRRGYVVVNGTHMYGGGPSSTLTLEP